MHAKYADLHFSYSAPVRVCTADAVSDAARDAMGVILRLEIAVRGAAFVRTDNCGDALRDATADAVRADVCADNAVRPEFCLMASLRAVVGTKTPVRAATDARSDFTVVDTRCWTFWDVVPDDLSRDMVLPSRTAAPAP